MHLDFYLVNILTLLDDRLAPFCLTMTLGPTSGKGVTDCFAAQGGTWQSLKRFTTWQLRLLL
jgi:hypothetical protein